MFNLIVEKYVGKIETYSINEYEKELIWFSDLGIGYLESCGYEYGDDYWKIYQKYSVGDFGELLTLARVKFVSDNCNLVDLCDVGVGSGQFVDTIKCKGSDVNPIANKWLEDHDYYTDDVTKFKTLTFWDVIEHINDPREMLSKAENVFISTPIYSDAAHCLTSKHLKPGEHIWYFTDNGIKYFMSLLGFECIAEDDIETVLGRDNILSYYFKKISL
jgi:hypothetical protein